MRNNDLVNGLDTPLLQGWHQYGIARIERLREAIAGVINQCFTGGSYQYRQALPYVQHRYLQGIHGRRLEGIRQ